MTRRTWDDPDAVQPNPSLQARWTTWVATNGSKFACADSTDNPAWIDAKATPNQIAAAEKVCAGCPLHAECKAWNRAGMYPNTDGVIAGKMHHTPTEGYEQPYLISAVA